MDFDTFKDQAEEGYFMSLEWVKKQNLPAYFKGSDCLCWHEGKIYTVKQTDRPIPGPIKTFKSGRYC